MVFVSLVFGYQLNQVAHFFGHPLMCKSRFILLTIKQILEGSKYLLWQHSIIQIESLFLEIFFNLSQAHIGMFRHSKVSKDKTDAENAREKPECTVETQGGDQLGEQLGQHRQAHHGAQEQD